MEAGSLEKLCKERRSIRKWSSQEVPEALVLKAIELGTWAPSGGGNQPYHFYVVANPSKISALAQAVQQSTDFIASLPAAQDDAAAVLKWQKNAAFFATAPVLIGVTASTYQSLADKILSASLDDPEAVKIMAARKVASSRVQSAAAAINQTLLALHTFGLGAVWMTGPVQAKKEIEKILGVPEKEDFVALIPVGYPAESPGVPEHKAQDALVTILR